MVSREFIHSVIKSNHVIAVHMKDAQRLDGLSTTIYVIYNLILSEEDEIMLIQNRTNRIDTHGLLKVSAVRTSEVDISLQDDKPHNYTINTMDIESYELMI